MPIKDQEDPNKKTLLSMELLLGSEIR